MRALATALLAAGLLASPLSALAAAKKTPPPAPAAGAAPAAKPATKGTSKMSGCAAQWKAMSDADKGKYKTKAEGMKSKKGGKLSGYNVWTGECMKKA